MVRRRNQASKENLHAEFRVIHSSLCCLRHNRVAGAPVSFPFTAPISKLTSCIHFSGRVYNPPIMLPHIRVNVRVNLATLLQAKVEV